VTATPPKPSLVKSTALTQATAVTNRLNNLLPTVLSPESPVTVYQAGTIGVGAQLNAPTSVFPAGAGYYGVWTAPDLNSGKDYTIQVECFGGGGGGGGGSVTTGGGGGGGGEYAAETYYPVKPGTDYVWVVGVPGSAGTANNDNNQGATAGGTGGLTLFDIAGTGVAGGVSAHGGQGGDVGNTGLGGLGGSGSFNTTEYSGGLGATDLPGGGGGSGGQGGTDNPGTLFTAGLLSAPPQAWYVLNDASSNGLLNDFTDNDNNPSPGSYSGGGLAYGQPGAASQVPAYTGGGDGDDIVNPTLAGAQLQFVLKQLNQQSGYVLCPGFTFHGSQLTISGWVTPDPSGTWGNTATGSRSVVAANCEGYASSSTAGVALYFSNSGTPSHPSWTLNWYCANSSTAHTVSTPVAPVAGIPVYVVATFSSGTMNLYVNGTLAVTASAGFSSIPTWPTVPFALSMGSDPEISTDWFFGYMSNFWFADGILSSGGVTQAYSGSGGSSTEGGAGGGASGGPAAAGGAGAAGSGSSGGAGGTPATQPAADIGLNTPASAGIAGAAGNAGNSGITGAAGAGGGGAGSSTSPPNIITVQVPFTTAASYCGTDAAGGAAGAVYNPVIQGTTGRLFTGGQSQDSASGSKNSLLILPPNLAAGLQNGNYTVTRVTLTVTNANPMAAQNALMQVGWSTDTFLPITYTAADLAGSAGVVEIPVGAYQVTADLTESQLGTYLQSSGATALVLGPGSAPTFAAYSAETAADFYTAVYGPGATDNAGNSLAPYLTITYAQSTTVQQGSPGGAGAILLTYLNQAQTLVGNWTSTAGLNAQGGQLTETSVVLGSANVTDGFALRMAALSEEQRETVRSAVRDMLGGEYGKRLGGGIAGAPGIIAGYTAGTTTTTQTTPGAYTFTVPAGVTSLNVQCWGAGAGGTGGNSSNGQGAGGGGAYAGEPNYTVVPGDVIHYTVGAGGTGDPVGSSSHPSGGSTTFDTTNVAGSGVNASGGQYYQSGFNYGPGGSTSGNTVAFSGGNGGPLNHGQPNGSGGGGSAGSAGNGGGGSQGGTAGAAGNGGGAVGGQGSNTSSGSNGTAPGGGGGGAVHGSSGNSGGNGGNGKVNIVYASSTALATSVATASGTDGAGNPYPIGVMTPALQVNGTSAVTTSNVSGTTTTGVLNVSGTATVGGALTANTQVLINATGAAALEVGGNAHITSGLQVDGSITTSSGGSIPQAVPSTAGSPAAQGTWSAGQQAWAASVTTIVNDLRAQLLLAGVLQ
jgi:Concanavalin A-like lectin/glucanases superfamily